MLCHTNSQNSDSRDKMVWLGNASCIVSCYARHHRPSVIEIRRVTRIKVSGYGQVFFGMKWTKNSCSDLDIVTDFVCLLWIFFCFYFAFSTWFFIFAAGKTCQLLLLLFCTQLIIFVLAACFLGTPFLQCLVFCSVRVAKFFFFFVVETSGRCW